jgi:murein endopeptidase
MTARTYPSVRAPSAGRLPARTPLTVLRRAKDADAVAWLKLTYRKTTGWVPASRTKSAPEPRCPSRSTGSAGSGRLFCGKLLPATTSLWVTYHPLTGAYPNSPARRWGSDSMLRTVEIVTQAYWQRFRNAPRVVVGDISLRRGGSFGAHASHQQGLDVDVYYPRRGDGRARTPRGPGEVDRRRAQWLVERFARERAEVVFVGVRVGIRRTRSNIKYLGAAHETHFHVRLRR